MKERIGEQMVRLDMLSFEQAETILRYQEAHPGMKFGEIAVKLGFLQEELAGKVPDDREKPL